MYLSVFELVDVVIVDTEFFRAYLIDQNLPVRLHRRFSIEHSQKMNRYFLPCRIYNSVVVKNN